MAGDRALGTSGPGSPRPPLRSGTVSPAFVRLLAKYGASPRLLGKVKNVMQEHQERPQHDLDERTHHSGTRHRPWRRVTDWLERIVGTDPDLMQRLPIQQARYQAASIVLLLRTLAAILVATAALAVVESPIIMAAAAGVSWGVISFLTDRWLLAPFLDSMPFLHSLCWLFRLLVSTLNAVALSHGITLTLFSPALDAHISVSPTGLTRWTAWQELSAHDPDMGRTLVLITVSALMVDIVLATWLAVTHRRNVYRRILELQKSLSTRRRVLETLRQDPPQPTADADTHARSATMSSEDVRAALARLEERVAQVERDAAEIVHLAAHYSAPYGHIIGLFTRRRQPID